MAFRMLASGTIGVIFLLAWSAHAQEAPSLEWDVSPEGANLTYRTDLCAIQRGILEGRIRPKEALKGLQLSVLVSGGEHYYNANSEGELDPTYPGWIPSLLDEIALRGGFTWRQSFARYDGPPDGMSYTDFVAKTVLQFDIVADYYMHTAERMARGVSFPEGFMDYSMMIVGRETGFAEELHLLSWTRPFTLAVWMWMLGAMLASAAIFWVLEHHVCDGDLAAHRRGKDLWTSFFLAAITFTGAGGFAPRTFAGRLFVLSWSFWCLLVVSAYTASLATALVSSKVNHFSVRSMLHAASTGVPVCVWEGTAQEDVTRKTFPSAHLVLATHEAEALQRVDQGECAVAVSAPDSFEALRRSADVNPSCALHGIGTPWKHFQAGFATASDSGGGGRCTSLVRDVIDLIMKELKNGDGNVAALLRNKYLQAGSEQQCAEEDSSKLASSPLSLNSMGGTFAVHAAVSVLALLMTLASYLTGHRGKPWHHQQGDQPGGGGSGSFRAHSFKAQTQEWHRRGGISSLGGLREPSWRSSGGSRTAATNPLLASLGHLRSPSSASALRSPSAAPLRGESSHRLQAPGDQEEEEEEERERGGGEGERVWALERRLEQLSAEFHAHALQTQGQLAAVLALLQPLPPSERDVWQRGGAIEEEGRGRERERALQRGRAPSLTSTSSLPATRRQHQASTRHNAEARDHSQPLARDTQHPPLSPAKTARGSPSLEGGGGGGGAQSGRGAVELSLGPELLATAT